MSPSPPARVRARGQRRLGMEGAILLEVLLALALFVAAAAVVTSALSASLGSLERQRLGTQSVNLAASVLAEIQLGIRSSSGEAAKPFEAPFEDWTWELAVGPAENRPETVNGLTLVEVVVRNTKTPHVQRLAQLMRLGSATSGSTNSSSGRAF